MGGPEDGALTPSGLGLSNLTPQALVASPHPRKDVGNFKLSGGSWGSDYL